MTDLDRLGECVENLTAHLDGSQEVLLASFVDDFFAGIVPVEVHDRFLQTKEVVDCAVDQIDTGGVTWLGPEVVLEL